MSVENIMRLTCAIGFLIVIAILAIGCAEIPPPHGDECERANVFLIGTRLSIGYVYDCETRSVYRELDKFNSRQWIECDKKGTCTVYEATLPKK